MDEGTRLNKFLSEYGICSRREADRLIAAGMVLVDGAAAVMGQKVLPGQIVSCRGKMVEAASQKEAPVLLMVNKPAGIVCTTTGNDRAPNIVDLVGYPSRIYPVGRLDKESEGLILMTNQGELVNRIMRAANHHEKEYEVTVDKPVGGLFLDAMARGVPILDTVTRPCKIFKTGDRSFTIILTQGLNRQIRRMCEKLGYEVRSLRRVRIMNLRLGNLKTGTWREVTLQEYQDLVRQLDGRTGKRAAESES